MSFPEPGRAHMRRRVGLATLVLMSGCNGLLGLDDPTLQSGGHGGLGTQESGGSTGATAGTSAGTFPAAAGGQTSGGVAGGAAPNGGSGGGTSAQGGTTVGSSGGTPGDGGGATAPDAGCADAAVCTPGVPRLIAPHSIGMVTSRRPTLRWTATSMAQSYRVELCSDPGCATAILALSTTSISAQPSVDLPQAHPVFWRVIAINDSLSSTSPTWEFFVGRRSAPVDTSWLGPPDFDRNGLSDVALGSASARAFLMLNSPIGGLPVTGPSQTISGPSGFGNATANAGDVNGDGYGDLVVGADSSGSAAVFLGNGNGVNSTPELLSSGQPGFGLAVAGVGDVNRDGYADVVVSDSTYSYLYLGGATGVATTANGSALAGSPAGGAGDVNGDGYADVVVCDNAAKTATVYLGSAAGLSGSITIVAPTGETSFGETCIGAGDVNGDGFSEIMVANDGTAKAFVFYGSPTGTLQAGPSQLSGATTGGSAGVINSIATAGDVNGDGYADVIIGGYSGNRVYIYHGAPGGISPTAATTFDNLPPGKYAASVAAAGDVNGDGYGDVVFGPTTCSGYDVYVYPGSATGVTKPASLRNWAAPSGVACLGNIAR
jgi:hypothetical protein